jgi:hypothetical protein
MFKLIGGAVVFGFAVYGLVTYLDRTKSREAIKPGDAEQVAGSDDAGAAQVSERMPSLDSAASAHAIGV